MKNILIIGGTRNMGFHLTQSLLREGHHVTILNRGMSPDNLPDSVHRLRADRTDSQQMKRALMGKSFDVVVDFVIFDEPEAQVIVQLLRDRVEHYIFISTGQVYLVREGIQRPFSEDDYAGRLQPQPKPNTFAFEEWVYGVNKRKAEDVFSQAHEDFGFPITSLRLPMVNSERDTFQRLYSYIIRLKDGSPILVPETPTYPLRHIYGRDVVSAIEKLIATGDGIGRAYNISQEETVTIDEFLGILGEHMNVTPQIVRVKRSLLEANGFLPHCSPFSERWMSELDNARSKGELGIRYTPLHDYLGTLVEHYTSTEQQTPVGYKRRHAERQLAQEQLSSQDA
ncbi:MAG: NAD-dependent epimerase/dehydratase family protein [Chloroflexota bacterium]